MEPESDKAPIPLPEAVEGLLGPVSADSPAGKDASQDDAYFKLDMEIGKINPDYAFCLDLATGILREKSKDLRVAAWLGFIWYRTEKMPGFARGLALINGLLARFPGILFPFNPAHRTKALQFLNSARVTNLLEIEAIVRDNAQDFIDAARVLEQLNAAIRNAFTDPKPELKELSRILVGHAVSAEKILVQPAEASLAPAPAVRKTVPERPVPPSPGEKKLAPERDDKKSGAAAPSIRDFQIGSDKEAFTAFKKALKYLVLSAKDDIQRLDPSVFGLARSVVWGKIGMPTGENRVSLENAPDGSAMTTLQSWFSGRDWDKIIPAVELNFLDDDSHFKYWLTAQRYAASALGQKGGAAAKSAEEIKFQSARLLTRVPDLPLWSFSNGVPFADEETRTWIENDVKPVLGGGGAGGVILPPILGEEFEPLNQEFLKWAAELPANFEANLASMEKSVAGETRAKGRFLRLLHIADFCIKARQYELARVRLLRLRDAVEERRLEDWEPALALAVWEAAYFVNAKLADAMQDAEEKEALARENRDLFSKIGNCDGLLAIKLAGLIS